MKIYRYAILLIIGVFLFQGSIGQVQARERWSCEKAEAWYSGQPWIVGCNFIPSTAINQLEMWQEDTFDPETIDRELGYAKKLGFNSVRVYLHHLVWTRNSKRFKERINEYLKIADSHNIKTIFVLFDDC